jgi:uncharacterized damage-inducible protein DinB
MRDVGAIRELYRYNEWANARMFEAVARTTREQFVEDLGSSFPSLRDTLTHIVWGEWLWLQRWKGISPQTRFQPLEFPRVEVLRERWQHVTAEQRDFLDWVTADHLTSVVRYANLQGQTWEYPLWRQLYHVVNHSTYHRGQVATLLRQLGTAPVPTDFLVFHDELQV